MPATRAQTCRLSNLDFWRHRRPFHHAPANSGNLAVNPHLREDLLLSFPKQRYASNSLSKNRLQLAFILLLATTGFSNLARANVEK
jgi:hypothetical protein